MIRISNKYLTELPRFLNFKKYFRGQAYKVYILLFILVSVCASASQVQEEDNAENIRRFSGPYCGLQCVYFILRSSGQEVSFSDILKPEYISSWKGSSLSELKKAVEDYGLFAEHYNHLTITILKEIHAPIILYVKKAPNSKKYNHYVLFLGIKNDNAIVYDTPNQISLVPLHILASYWSGVGLVISGKEIKSNTIFASTRERFIVYVAIISGVILFIRLFNKKAHFYFLKLPYYQKMGLSIIQGGLLLLFSLLVSFVGHFCNENGFFFQPYSTSDIQAAYKSSFIPKISKSRILNMACGNTTFIDARLAKDYNAGHMHAAINIPVTSSDEQRYKLMAGIARDSKVIVYCQSSGCPYANMLTIKLIEDGYKDVSVFKGGWVEWQKSQESQTVGTEGDKSENPAS